MKDCKINFNNVNCLPNLQLRRLLQSDITHIQKLCEDWFPIDYPMTWYMDITTNDKFHALAAVLTNSQTNSQKIVGILVAEIKNQLDCNLEDRNLLSRRFEKSSKVVYLLVLGVERENRRRGIATYLLESLINFLTLENSNKDVKAIYLHTLTTNKIAINFYKKKSFNQHLYLPLYYYIDYEERDGASYVLYINGGYPPLFLIDYLSPLVNFVSNKFNPRGIIYSLKKFVHRTITLVRITLIRNVSNHQTEETQLLFC